MQHFVLETALNYLISQQRIDIGTLSGKNLHFQLESLPLEMNFVCTERKIYVLSTPIESADVEIQLKKSVLFSLFKGEDIKQLLREDQIVINGDVKTAQLLVDLLEQVDIDPEEILSTYTGDVIANEAGKAFGRIRRAASEAQNPLEVIKDEIANFLIQPEQSESFKKPKS